MVRLMYIINHHLICSLGSLNLIQKDKPAINPMLFIVAIVSITAVLEQWLIIPFISMRTIWIQSSKPHSTF